MNFLVNDNSPTLKFDNFSHFQNVISNNLFPQPANVIMTLAYENLYNSSLTNDKVPDAR